MRSWGALLACPPPPIHTQSRSDLTFTEGVTKTNAGLPNLHPIVLEFGKDIGAEWWGKNHASANPAVNQRNHVCLCVFRIDHQRSDQHGVRGRLS
jgi:hypothetical protein